MTRSNKWALGLGIAAAVLIAAGLAAAWWLPTDEELASRLMHEAEERLGVQVTIGSAHWALVPWPVVVANDIRTHQAQPVTIGQITVNPKVRSLLRGEIALESLSIRDGTFPRNSVRALRGKPGGARAIALERFVFRNVTWGSYSGVQVPYDGEIDFDLDGRPGHAELRRPGVSPPFRLAVTREGAADRWQARINVGGGTMHGDVTLETDPSGTMRLRGRLAPRDVEVASAVSTFNRRPFVGGRGSGQTLVTADGKSPRELLRSLHTRTVFTISPAKILRLDLHKAISTLGKDRDGETLMEELTGQLDTQNTAEGLRATYTNLKARSQEYSATDQATIHKRHVEASGTLYVEKGGGAVPFTLSGPLGQPKTTFSRGAVAGAAVKKAGSEVGDALRRIFQTD